MNRDQIRLLHGLYYYREQIDEVCVYEHEQLAWLIAHPVSKTKQWVDSSGRLRTQNLSTGSELESFANTWRTVDDALRALVDTGLIESRSMGAEIHLKVTRQGAQVAAYHHVHAFGHLLPKHAIRHISTALAAAASAVFNQRRRT